MNKHNDYEAMQLARQNAYELGLLIRENSSAECRSVLLQALLDHLEMQDSYLANRIERHFEIGLAQGMVDAYLKGRRD